MQTIHHYHYYWRLTELTLLRCRNERMMAVVVLEEAGVVWWSRG